MDISPYRNQLSSQLQHTLSIYANSKASYPGYRSVQAKPLQFKPLLITKSGPYSHLMYVMLKASLVIVAIMAYGICPFCGGNVEKQDPDADTGVNLRCTAQPNCRGFFTMVDWDESKGFGHSQRVLYYGQKVDGVYMFTQSK
ncbi:hypothetical protein TOPH_02391 [Tolypocladium ophioglossoides CBS 100239]|uniref:Uncharacterized protein n=1 Tax=Tolypocladium ophioglossoides (strain CBS 100239) TaxID=1163406 RepID=A0A0L0NGT9_TOLOC|nr:hypothetical protein TOPH_02391 [Tolypocladium ophioglossoides CBS 100239]